MNLVRLSGAGALALGVSSAAPATATVITFDRPVVEREPVEREAAVVLSGGRRVRLSDAFDALILELPGDLDPRLVKAVVAVESGFDPLALSDRQAMGLMQITPGTARGLGLDEPFDARVNIEAGARYLAALLERFGDLRLALGAYNAGPDRIVQYRGLPPFPETQTYVRDVIALSDRLGADLDFLPAPAGVSLFPIVMEWTDED